MTARVHTKHRLPRDPSISVAEFAHKLGLVLKNGGRHFMTTAVSQLVISKPVNRWNSSRHNLRSPPRRTAPLRLRLGACGAARRPDLVGAGATAALSPSDLSVPASVILSESDVWPGLDFWRDGTNASVLDNFLLLINLLTRIRPFSKSRCQYH